MGTHAKPRTRVRTIALGTLAVGATLTGVGLTAAALDPAGANLAGGAPGGDAVDLAASGLGAPVPVADVSSLAGGGLTPGTLSVGTLPALGAGSVTQGLLPGSGSATGVRPRQQVQEPTWAHGATVGGVPEHVRPQGGATSNSPSTAAGSSASGGNTGSISNSGNGNSGITDGGSGNLTDLTGLLPASSLPLDQLNASEVDKTLNQVAPGVPGNVSTGLGQAKSTLSGLLNQVAGLL